MNAVAVSTVIVAVAALMSPGSVPAGTSLQRCESADGEVAYTDRPCAMLGTRPLPMPGELLTRIAREEAAYTRDIDFGDAPAIANVGRRSPTSGCARNKRQLAMDIQGSLALHNVNRLAESYHWVGKSHRQAQQHMLRLEKMASQRLLDAKLFYAQIGSGATQFADAGTASPGAGIVQLTLGNGATRQVVDLEVTRYSGCYFVRL
ncbi:hypothetical protein [Pseudoxanthomonas sacheonensis]|uniref:DUF4124 domain-containing protein n=1 Tax=Pseudoxanthomonas sacheonensis TaxID=443615 RepID=A0ABU1RM42_9GAMM|nr:hypothetical protein [Pseudoxanthomonas sacheonensis]MDR6839842.1 hypothetical protein [Pseudoxanthomonas sacheonensis]